MNIDPVRYTGRPAETRSAQEEAIYDKLDELGISFDRADHDFADTMEDCLAIERVIGGSICKNLFLCNRQQTEFYLLLMPGDKPFKTKYLSSQIGCTRLSFADAAQMEKHLHTVPGSVSAFELLFDAPCAVRLLIDRELLTSEYACGHPGFSTSTIRLGFPDFLRYLSAVRHDPTVIDLPRPED